jgi:NMT1/THI5 like
LRFTREIAEPQGKIRVLADERGRKRRFTATRERMVPHNDGFGFGDFGPDYLFLWCGRPDSAGEGASFLVDGLALLEQLAADPDYADVARFAWDTDIDQSEPNFPLAAYTPIARRLPNGRVQVRHHPFRAPARGRAPHVEAAQAAMIKRWSEAVSAVRDSGPVQFDPTPLTQGTVDGWFSFITSEPNELRSKGFDVTTFLLADQGYPLVSETYFTTTSTLSSKPDVVAAFLKAEIAGWKDNIADPALGATLTVNTYGKGLGLTIPEQTLESKSENELILTADTTKNGLFTVTPALIEANLKTLAIGGISLTQDKLFDLSILEGIYKDDPSLV